MQEPMQLLHAIQQAAKEVLPQRLESLTARVAAPFAISVYTEWRWVERCFQAQVQLRCIFSAVRYL